jgi:hypothetical protein
MQKKNELSSGHGPEIETVRRSAESMDFQLRVFAEVDDVSAETASISGP